MSKNINDIQQAMGIKKEDKNKNERVEIEEYDKDKEEIVDNIETSKKEQDNVFPIPTTDRFYNLIINSPVVTPTDIKIYKVENGYVFVLLDSLNRAYPGSVPNSINAFFIEKDNKVANKLIEILTD
jgi:hypothetical protein